MKLLRLIMITLMLIPGYAMASDYAREQRWANQIIDAIFDGEPVWLQLGNDKKFLGILAEPEEDSNRGAIIMHGTGVHPNWQQVIYPLRVGLVQHGWHTLSIQMPILESQAEYDAYAPLFDEVAPRINAAIKLLKDNGVEQIVLIGHSLGASMGAYYLSQSPQKVDGFVAVGIGAFKTDARMNALKNFEKISKTPVLDIYGSEDLEGILADAPARAKAATGNNKYKQIRVEGAGHMFDDREAQLVEAVADWLNDL